MVWVCPARDNAAYSLTWCLKRVTSLSCVLHLETEAKYFNLQSYLMSIHVLKYACRKPTLLFSFFPPYQSPAERAVLGCQLGPACTSQGRGRHSQTQPESIQASQHSPFRLASQHSFQPGRDSREKRDREWQKKLNYHKVSHKARYKREEKETEEELWMNTHKNTP